MARYCVNGGKVNEEGHGKPWRAFFRTGYIKGLNATQRSAGANMSVDVNLDSTLNFAAAQISTSSNINYFGWIDAVENVTVSAAHATLPRKDRLVAYIDLALITSATTNNLNALKFMVVAGTAAASPVVPTAGTIQTAIGASNPYIVLADVNVAAATTTIVTANITDARTPAALNMPYLWGGALNTNGHLVPNVGDDTLTLLNAVQTVKGKSLSLSGNTSTGNILTNPYKFSVYRNAAATTSNAPTLVQFDTKEFDTGTNIDVVTNKGRFTAPVAGFYQLNSVFGNSSIGAGGLVYLQLYKNGLAVRTGDAKTQAAAGQPLYGSISALLSLAAGDYVEVFCVAGLGSTAAVGPLSNYFCGHLVSHL